MFTRKTVLTFLAAFTLALPLCAQKTLDDLLDSVRQATGHETMRSWKRGIVVEGHGEALGLKSEFLLQFLSNGRFRTDTISELPGIQGFDGQRGWNVDASGMPGHLETKDLELKKMMAWLMGGHWLDADGPLLLSLESREDDVFLDRIMVAIPDGCIRAWLEVDRVSDLPVQFTWIERGQEQHMEFEDYREVAGFLYPHTFRAHEDGQVKLIEVDRVYEATEASEAACRPITRRPDDMAFDPKKSRSLEVKVTPTGHILVHPLLNGKDVGWFFLDTGAGWSAVDKGAAERLELEKLGEVTAVGMGGQVEAQYRKAACLEVGPLKMKNPTFVEVDLTGIGTFFECELGGALGYNFLSRVQVELDAQEKEVTLFEAGTWTQREEPWQEIIFDGNIPTVVGRTEGGLEGLFHLDTGSGGTVEFHTAFVKSHKLLEGREVKKAMAGGVGGFVTTYAGKVDWFELGGHRFVKPDVTFADTEKGVFSDESSAGNIGNGFMSHFRLLIDYPGKRIGFIERAE